MAAQCSMICKSYILLNSFLVKGHALLFPVFTCYLVFFLAALKGAAMNILTPFFNTGGFENIVQERD